MQNLFFTRFTRLPPSFVQNLFITRLFIFGIVIFISAKLYPTHKNTFLSTNKTWQHQYVITNYCNEKLSLSVVGTVYIFLNPNLNHQVWWKSMCFVLILISLIIIRRHLYYHTFKSNYMRKFVPDPATVISLVFSSLPIKQRCVLYIFLFQTSSFLYNSLNCYRRLLKAVSELYYFANIYQINNFN